MNSPIAISCIPFLKSTKVIQITNSATPRVYKYVSSHFQYVSRIICISPKQLEELRPLLSQNEIWGKMQLVPHGIKWIEKLEPDSNSDCLTIGFLGRIHHGHKGVLFIPKILKSLSIPFRLELIGDGEDKEELFELLDHYHIQYISHGVVKNNQLNQYLKTWDVLLFPSLVEGFGLTLIEAMNNGVVPISNHLPGVTDFIIENSVDGFIVPNNKISEYVQRINYLNENRDILKKMKLAANKTIKNEFNLEKIIKQYESMFLEVMKEGKPGKVINFQDWIPYQEYKPQLLNRIKHKLYALFQ